MSKKSLDFPSKFMEQDHPIELQPITMISKTVITMITERLLSIEKAISNIEKRLVKIEQFMYNADDELMK